MNTDTTGEPAVAEVPEGLPDDAQMRRVETVISSLLRWGVRLSLLLFVTGSLLAFGRDGEYGSAEADVERLTGREGAFPRNVRWLAAGVAGFRGTPLIVAGLLLLIATPVLRVAVSIAVFAGQRDRVFIFLTVTVLGLLILSFVLGRAVP